MIAYDQLAQHYIQRRKDKSRFDYNRDIEVPAFLKFVGKTRGKDILDLGCGFGDHAAKMARENYRSFVGLDISKELIQHAQQQQIPCAQFYVGDMRKKLKHPHASFDIVISSLAIHYVPNIKLLFKEVHRVLRKKGIFCFSTGHPIFNLMNQSPEFRIGIEKRKEKKMIIHGNYFDEKQKKHNLGSLGKVMMCNFTYQTIIQTGIAAGFQLIDYKDAIPTKGSKKYDSEKHHLTSTLPTFILFKFRKQ